MSKQTCPIPPESPRVPSELVRKKRERLYQTGWSQKEPAKILKTICQKYPAITYLNVSPNSIVWNFECKTTDLIKQKPIDIYNPSRRNKK